MVFTDTAADGPAAIAAGDRYPTPDEVLGAARGLAARHPGLCGLRIVGTSRAGRPLHLLSIGRAARGLLIVAGAHANEAVGGATVLELARRALAEPALRTAVSWHFLLCLDPDSAALAAGAEGDPRSQRDYFRRYYRPAADEQPEWAAQLTPELPESRALLQLIAELRPFLQFSLHGTDVGGTFVESTAELPGLAQAFGAAARDLGIPVETGPYDAYYWPSPAPGVFLMPPGSDVDVAVASSKELRTTTWHAPQRYGGATVILEVPTWACERLADTTPLPDPSARLAVAADQLRSRGALVAERLAEVVARGGLDGSPFVRAARSTLSCCSELADEWDPRVAGLSAPLPAMTHGRLAAVELWAHRIPLRAASLVRRALGTAGGAGPDSVAPDSAAPGLPAVAARLDGLLDDWCAEYQRVFPSTWVPVARQVEQQVRTVLAMVMLDGQHPQGT
ncbi:M14 family zinc carboxypeptidase [Kitasatospora sp. NPDC008050]|uniref:M14 family zinc carboxypeptidase n=1 Tax=Kitasatospora sp. NPDC008050 TaxID=3364021 RepID=UPI0036E43F6E